MNRRLIRMVGVAAATTLLLGGASPIRAAETWVGPETIAKKPGAYFGIAPVPGGVVAVWEDGISTTLLTARRIGGTWTRPRRIAENFLGPQLGSLDIDTHGHTLHATFIVHGDQGEARQVYLRDDGSDSVTEDVGPGWWSPSVAVDASGTAFILASADEEMGVRVRPRDGQLEPLTPLASMATGRLVIDDANEVHLLYRQNDEQLVHRSRSASGWSDPLSIATGVTYWHASGGSAGAIAAWSSDNGEDDGSDAPWGLFTRRWSDGIWHEREQIGLGPTLVAPRTGEVPDGFVVLTEHTGDAVLHVWDQGTEGWSSGSVPIGECRYDKGGQVAIAFEGDRLHAAAMDGPTRGPCRSTRRSFGPRSTQFSLYTRAL